MTMCVRTHANTPCDYPKDYPCCPGHKGKDSMRIIYRASTQCDCCKKVTDTPAPNWENEMRHMGPGGWIRLRMYRVNGMPVEYICDECKTLPFDEVIIKANVEHTMEDTPLPLTPRQQAIADTATEDAIECLYCLGYRSPCICIRDCKERSRFNEVTSIKTKNCPRMVKDNQEPDTASLREE